jgi:cytochrome c-type biogenesis protein CcmH
MSDSLRFSWRNLDSVARSLSILLAEMALAMSFALLFLLAFADLLHATDAAAIEEQTRAVSEELRCVVCQNLSVADSPSEMAQQMRAVVREQLEAGKTPEQIKEFFVSKYGEWVLLKPKASGFSLLLWILPYIGLAVGLIIALWCMRRWARKRRRTLSLGNDLQDRERLRREILEDFEPPASEDTSPRAELLRERALLRAELTELEFDFESGKHSEAEFMALRDEIESKAAEVFDKLAGLPPVAAPKRAKDKKPLPKSADERINRSRHVRGWQIAVGGAFLLLFGLALGILLTQSLRPRASSEDTITGDFMTGTGGEATSRLLEEGKQAFAKQDFAKAIDAFKAVLAQDPDQPEAHVYMGFILAQAGHGDGALLAFDRALAVAPNFPMALWGKGMVLYQHRKDYAGARAAFENLLGLLPPGDHRNQVTKVLAEIPVSGAPPKSVPGKAGSATSNKTISGKISIDAKLKDRIADQAALFLIARPAAGGAGPPLAVKKIDKPKFPLTYSLGQENVMMQGTQFTGKINLSARLDKDGNAMTKDAGDLLGDYKKNPVEVGSRDVDITLDQLAP